MAIRTNGADDLARFLNAQSRVYEQVVAELSAGRKQSHWMWFIFPQLKGLGHSAASEYFGISDRSEAAAYGEHPILGTRLRECTQLVLDVRDRRVEEILPYPDHLKFHSSMTLFMIAARDGSLFSKAIEQFFCGEPDRRTAKMLGPA